MQEEWRLPAKAEESGSCLPSACSGNKVLRSRGIPAPYSVHWRLEHLSTLQAVLGVKWSNGWESILESSKFQRIQVFPKIIFKANSEGEPFPCRGNKSGLLIFRKGRKWEKAMELGRKWLVFNKCAKTIVFCFPLKCILGGDIIENFRFSDEHRLSCLKRSCFAWAQTIESFRP